MSEVEHKSIWGCEYVNDENLIEKLTDKQQIYNGKIIDLQLWNVTLPNGVPAGREVVVHRGASAIVPVDEEGSTYLVRQFRTPVNCVLTEIPAGKLDYAGEDRLEAAKRELREETGFTAKKWTHLVDLKTTPGFATEIISVYLARDLSRGETEFDDDEFIDLIKIPLSEAAEMAFSGKLTDAKTITGLLLAQKRVNGEE